MAVWLHCSPPSSGTGGAYFVGGIVTEPTPRQAAVILDYQNVHLTGHGLYESTRHADKHLCLVDPLLYANAVLRTRNARQLPGHAPAVLHKVLVYRGNPTPEHAPQAYARNLRQKDHWERDPRVHVTLRPLKYYYMRDAAGAIVYRDNQKVVERIQEKGVDVLCALAVIREACDPNVDLVILASSDSDLEPAIEEAHRMGAAKIETASWWNAREKWGQQLRLRELRVWNTRLDETVFNSVRDTQDYT